MTTCWYRWWKKSAVYVREICSKSNRYDPSAAPKADWKKLKFGSTLVSVSPAAAGPTPAYPGPTTSRLQSIYSRSYLWSAAAKKGHITSQMFPQTHIHTRSSRIVSLSRFHLICPEFCTALISLKSNLTDHNHVSRSNDSKSPKSFQNIFEAIVYTNNSNLKTKINSKPYKSKITLINSLLLITIFLKV